VLDEIFGIDAPFVRDVESWAGLVHPEDRVRALAHFQVEVLGERRPFDLEYRIVRRSDRETRWVHGRGRVQRDGDGRPRVMFGTIQDITQHREAEEALKRSEERYRSLMTQSAEGVVVFHPETLEIQEVNGATCRILGYTEDELSSMTIHDLVPAAERESVTANVGILLRTGRLFLAHRQYVRKDGSTVEAEVHVSLVQVGGSRLGLASARDIGERRRAEAIQSALYRIAEKTASASDLRGLYQAIHEIVGELMYARNFYIALHDPEGESLTFPYFVDEVDSEPPNERLGRGLTAYVLRTGEALLATPETFRHLVDLGEVEQVGAMSLDWLGVPLRSGTAIFGALVVQTYREGIRYTEKDREVLTFVSQHISTAFARKRAEDTIRHQAYHDTLTLLPNRLLFGDRLAQALARAERRKEKLAVLFLDLDRFKTINDTLGHAVGDRLLQEVARRLTLCLREGDTVARLGGDEFMVLLSDIQQLEDAAKIAEKILSTLRPAIPLEGHELHVTTSIGISIFPLDGEDAETLIKLADIALYRAKEHGRDTYQLYSPAMNMRTIELLAFENRLRGALDRGEFLVQYQPQVEIGTGRIVGVEALVRWRVPGGRLIPPDEFIPLSEDTGVIVPLGDWVLRTACRQSRLWESQGLGSIPVAVNISSRQFQQKNLGRVVSEALHESGLAPELLELELTESVLMRDAEGAAGILRDLRTRGVRISVDDFGAGYSSLSKLRLFPIHALKIDKSFVKHCTTDPDDAAIVAAIISMAHSLKLTVTAEGVETPEQLALLRLDGCDTAQGFLFSQAVDADALAEILERARAGTWLGCAPAG